MHIILGLAMGVALLCLVCCLIATKPRKRVSSLSEEERVAWVERDRRAGFEKDRLARLAAPYEPGGFSMED